MLVNIRGDGNWQSGKNFLKNNDKWAEDLVLKFNFYGGNLQWGMV